MPHKPVPTKKWKKFLKHIGCEYVDTGKHEKWNKEGLIRPIIFRASYPEIPPMHIKSNLETLGMT